jgi:Leucine-rich repeat (LRR) protein
MIRIVLFVLNLTFITNAMAQTDVFTTYSKLDLLDKVSDVNKIETIFIANDSTLIFPLLANQKLPTNGIIITVPSVIQRFRNLKSLFFIGLYITNLGKDLENLRNIEKLKFAVPIGTNIDSLIRDLLNLKKLKVLDLSDSTISLVELKKITDSLPNIKLINTGFL